MTSWTSGICNANGIHVHYLRTGGCKPPLVLLHGLAADGACWTPLARALQGEYDVVMPDARGHGNSSTPLGGYRYEDFASDAVGLIHGLGLTDPIQLGHSMGGMTAAVIASQRVPPIRALILADPTFLSPERQHEVYESDVLAQHRRLLSSNKGDVLAQLRARHPNRSSEILELLAEARLQTRIQAFEILTPPNPEYKNLVSAISCPILLVIADRGAVSPETARELQRLNPRLQVEQIQNAGHGLPYDRPNCFAAIVLAFLQALPATTRSGAACRITR